ncbi:chemotaxis protein CheW [Oxynema sp. CENA135]|uniref:chemotaxis protein CheW n=1 Tax=Oxynema sp. CENA135 TaxID=984206 RepID=UPI0019092BB6|nr:chemotaxis protein CheW [Oxynema sp. CENA135]MBK4730422.1 chemotaxis protein CheW [Oxynema sp. CENA135]
MSINTTASSSSEEIQNFIFFELAGTTYGIEATYVQQMDTVERITPVPNALSFVEGVVFSRGQVLPVLNLRVRFGFEKIPYDIRTRSIVVRHQQRTVGLIVDTAREFISLTNNVIQPLPEGISGLSGKYLKGIITLENRVVLVLNVEELLKVEETPIVAGE